MTTIDPGLHAPTPALIRDVRGRAARVAGGALLLMAALAVAGVPLATGEPGADGAFRAGVACLYAVVVLDVVVAWALFTVFEEVDAGLARLAAWLRLAYSAVFLTGLAHLAGVPRLLDEGHGVEAGMAVESFHDVWTAGLVLFGLHLLVVGRLALASGFLPAAIGALVVLAGTGYVVDSVVAVLDLGLPEVSIVTFVGELLLAVWLLVRGVPRG